MLSYHSVQHWYSVFRAQAAKKFNDECSTDPLSFHVQVDKSLFGKRKYNRGRIGTQIWVLGACDQECGGKVYFTIVEDRTNETLCTILQTWVPPGAIINSDGWQGYNDLALQGYGRFVENHSENFVDPATGEHTQRIEALWSACKNWLRRHGYNDHSTMESYLKEWCLRFNHRASFSWLWENLFK
jgi:transposase-like protein